MDDPRAAAAPGSPQGEGGQAEDTGRPPLEGAVSADATVRLGGDPGPRVPRRGSIGGWLLAAALVAAGLRLGSPLGLTESLILAALLVLLPYLAFAQLEELAAEEIDRVSAYTGSGLMLLLMGSLTLWIGLARGGPAYLGLEPAGVRDVIGWTAALTLACLVVIGLFHLIQRLARIPDAPWLRKLLPVTGREKRAFALLSVAAGIGEELVYRGYALAALLEVTGSPMAAAIGSSAAFGLVHAYQGRFGMVRAGLLGLIFCLPVLTSGLLWPAMAAHTVIDWIGGLVLGDRLIVDGGVTVGPDEAKA